MVRVAKVTALFLGLIFLVIFLWMNLTPGYFQYGVCGYVGYYTNDEVEVTKNWETVCRLPSGFERLEAQILIRSAQLDFNKGSRVGGIPPVPVQEDNSGAEGSFCGGSKNIPCPPGYTCKLNCTDQSSCPLGKSCPQNINCPDASGVCGLIYACPKKPYINCMPGIVGQPNELEPGTSCSTEYLDWAKAFCPSFQGPTY